MTQPTSDAAGRAPSTKAWQIAAGVLAVLLVLAVVVVFVVLRDDDEDESATEGTTATSASSEPYDLVCEPDDLLAAIPADVLAEGAAVAAFGCAPATVGDESDAYAWAEVESPGVEPLVAFYAGQAAGSGTPAVMDWSVLDYGTDLVCEDAIPIETCDMLAGAPRQGDTGSAADPEPGGTSATDQAQGTVTAMECTTADLLAAVPPDVLAEGAEVTTIACTPSSLAGADEAYAYLRAEAPGVNPIDVLFMTVAVAQPGSPTVLDWQAVTWGSAVVCDEHLPSEACDQLGGVPRA